MRKPLLGGHSHSSIGIILWLLSIAGIVLGAVSLATPWYYGTAIGVKILCFVDGNCKFNGGSSLFNWNTDSIQQVYEISMGFTIAGLVGAAVLFIVLLLLSGKLPTSIRVSRKLLMLIVIASFLFYLIAVIFFAVELPNKTNIDFWGKEGSLASWGPSAGWYLCAGASAAELITALVILRKRF